MNIIYLSLEPEKSLFLDLVLLRFTAVASCSFYYPSWRSTANSSSATLSCICFWIFLPSGIQSGEETDVGKQRLNRVLESLFTFTHLVFRTKQGAWHKLIHLMKGSDFPSTLACSRLSDRGEDAKVKGKGKVDGAKKRKRKRERACNHFFYDALPPTFGTFEIIRFRLSNCWNVNELESFSNFSRDYFARR